MDNVVFTVLLTLVCTVAIGMASLFLGLILDPSSEVAPWAIACFFAGLFMAKSFMMEEEQENAEQR